MKTILLKVLGAVLAVFLLTSCLGDRDSYVKIDDDFAYFKYDDLDGTGVERLYAWVSMGPILVPSSLSNTITHNRGYFVKYKINQFGKYYYGAEYLELLGDGTPVPTAAFKWDAPYTGFQPSQLADSIQPLSISEIKGSALNTIDDNWLIKYNVSLKEDETVEARFYYDSNGQYENGKALDKNQIIIDMRFVKKEKNTENVNAQSTELYALGSLAEVRSSYQPTYSSDADYVDVPIKFRYVENQGKTGYPPIIKTLGSFNLNSSSTEYVFFMRFYKKS